ncbi:DUF3822 family protein [Taibaiella lutea]|uniref:DUF3822 family protein n=1 Tax=Taibaiella lutea TaxID=2608001 RepID=A0A5M6CNH4_9BACT|nr:DUF3822 family protein [Taibaiella lutea]KAA5536684.1 DUF3822 family protein [Taibaiella lutea]
MSLIREERLQPVQHFNMHDDPLTNIETLHLLIWDQGLGIAGYGIDGNVLTTKVYTFAKDNIHAIESIFMNEPLVAGPQPVTHVWIAESRNILIPQHLFSEDAAKIWLEKFHFIAAGESIRTTTVKQPDALSIAYPVSNDLIALLNKNFPEAKIESFSGMVLQQGVLADSNTVDIVFMNETAALTIHQKGKLIAHQITSAEDIHNLVYKIASICQDYKIGQEDLKVSVSGFCVSEETCHELKAFYPKMSVPGSEQFSSFTLLSKLITCAS